MAGKVFSSIYPIDYAALQMAKQSLYSLLIGPGEMMCGKLYLAPRPVCNSLSQMGWVAGLYSRKEERLLYFFYFHWHYYMIKIS